MSEIKPLAFYYVRNKVREYRHGMYRPGEWLSDNVKVNELPLITGGIGYTIYCYQSVVSTFPFSVHYIERNVDGQFENYRIWQRHPSSRFDSWAEYLKTCAECNKDK